MANDGTSSNRWYWYCARQQELRVSFTRSIFDFYILKSHFSNIDAMFQKHSYLMFPSKPIHTDGVRAGVMVSVVFTP